MIHDVGEELQGMCSWLSFRKPNWLGDNPSLVQTSFCRLPRMNLSNVLLRCWLASKLVDRTKGRLLGWLSSILEGGFPLPPGCGHFIWARCLVVFHRPQFFFWEGVYLNISFFSISFEWGVRWKESVDRLSNAADIFLWNSKTRYFTKVLQLLQLSPMIPQSWFPIQIY